MDIGVKAYPKKKKGGSAMNQFIQFVSALAVSTLTESFKAWLSDKRSSKKHKNAIKLLYQIRQYLVFFYKKIEPGKALFLVAL